jgi:hypothetical protein
VGRGGILKDALSNIALQRSAIRTAHVTFLCRSRPVNAGGGRLVEYSDAPSNCGVTRERNHAK